MKILYDHQVFSWQKYGGVSRYFYEISRCIAELNEYDVEIFAPLYVNEYINNQSLIPHKGIHIPKIPRTGRIVNNINWCFSLLAMSSYRQDVDIFHETYYDHKNSCPRSAKRIVTVYDMIHEKFAKNFSRNDKTRKIKAHVVNRADHVICISENTRRDLIDILGVPEKKTSVVYLGCSLDVRTHECKSTLDRNPYILYVGNRQGHKNFDNFLRAYSNSLLLRKEYSIVCFGGGKFNAKELSLIRSLNIPQNNVVNMFGSDEILSGIYASAAVFVYPSCYEGFGIPPLEAMSLDCPVVCANSSSLPEVVGDAAILFDPNNIEAIRAAIESVVTSPELTNQLIKKGRKQLLRFSWEKCAKNTLATYRKVLDGEV